jgi:hypothetical protein
MIDLDTKTNPVVTLSAPDNGEENQDDGAIQENLIGCWVAKWGAVVVPDDSTGKLLADAQAYKNTQRFLIKGIGSDGKVSLSGRYGDNSRTPKTQRSQDQTKAAGTGTYIPALGAIISSPYIPNEPNCVRNGVADDRRNYSDIAPWKWIGNNIHPRQDGSVFKIPVPRSNPNGETMRLPVMDLVGNSGIADSVGGRTRQGAFCLTLGVMQGSNHTLSTKDGIRGYAGKPNPWSIKIEVGDIDIWLHENRPEAMVSFSGVNEEQVTINPGAATKTSSDMGEQPYNITFIPVFNGFLLSDGTPSSDNWESKVTYVSRDKTVSVDKIVEEKMFEKRKDICGGNSSWGPKGSDLPKDSKGFPGVQIDTAGSAPTGNTIRVTFYRCGGSVRYQPVLFCTSMRSSFVTIGDAAARSIPPAANAPPPDPNNPGPGGPPDGYTLVPVWYSEVELEDFQSDDTIDLSTFQGIERLGGGNPEYWAYRQGFSHVVVTQGQGAWVPAINWGCMIYWTAEGDGDTNPPMRNGEGVLDIGSLRTDLIKEVSVNRSFDGTSGRITWDVFPGGTADLSVGGLVLSVEGGYNTVPGVIYTGIGAVCGDATSSNSDTMVVDLHGREVKMTDSGGGLRIIDAPFFDGMDHNCVVEWLARYAGVPVNARATPYKLPSGGISTPIIDFQTGSPVWDAILELQKHAASIAYFDRFGVLQYTDVGRPNNTNWSYPKHKVETAETTVDVFAVRNTVVVGGLAYMGKSSDLGPFDVDFENIIPFFATERSSTHPEFKWDKMAFYVLPGIMKLAEMKAAAKKIIQSFTRARATGSVTIPGNAQIELLDTFNGSYVVVQVSHNVNMQSKTWTTSLALELLL